MFDGKGAAGVRFQVAFKSERAFAICETDTGFEAPWSEGGGGWDFA